MDTDRHKADSDNFKMKKAFKKFCREQNNAWNRSQKFHNQKKGIGKARISENSDIKENFNKSLRNYNSYLGTIIRRSI